jgi:hypothetical protein
VTEDPEVPDWRVSRYAKNPSDSFGQAPTLTPTFNNPEEYYPEKTTYLNMRAMDPRPGWSTRGNTVKKYKGSGPDGKVRMTRGGKVSFENLDRGKDVELRHKIHMSDPIPFVGSRANLNFDDGGQTPAGEKQYPYDRMREGYATLDKHKLHGGSFENKRSPTSARLGNDHAHNEEYGDGNALVYHTRELQTNRPGAHNFITLPGEQAVRQLGPTSYGHGINEANAYDKDHGPVKDVDWSAKLAGLEYYPNFSPGNTKANFWDHHDPRRRR